MAERPTPYSADKQGFFKVVGGDIVRPITFSDDEVQEIVPDSPEQARRREANRNRIEHTVFTYRLPIKKTWAGEHYDNGKGVSDIPRKKPKGYSDAYWAMIQKREKHAG